MYINRGDVKDDQSRQGGQLTVHGAKSQAFIYQSAAKNAIDNIKMKIPNVTKTELKYLLTLPQASPSQRSTSMVEPPNNALWGSYI